MLYPPRTGVSQSFELDDWFVPWSVPCAIFFGLFGVGRRMVRDGIEFWLVSLFEKGFEGGYSLGGLSWMMIGH